MSSVYQSLQISSPKLVAVVLKRFGPVALSQAEELYSRLFQSDLVRERELIREEGVSFNPRPCRLALLVLELEPEPTLADLLAAMALPESELPSRESKLWYAAALDKVRHLHMSKLSNAEKERLLSQLGHHELPEKLQHAINQQWRLLAS